MNIRLKHPKDYREVENLTREVFWNVYRPECTEHYVLNQYRTNQDFIPELDLVMERLRERLRVGASAGMGDGTSGMEEDKIIGHVMFSKAELLITPLSIGRGRGEAFPFPAIGTNARELIVPPRAISWPTSILRPSRLMRQPSRRRKSSACQDN